MKIIVYGYIITRIVLTNYYSLFSFDTYSTLILKFILGNVQLFQIHNILVRLN